MNVLVNCTLVSQVSSVFNLNTQFYHQLKRSLHVSYKVIYYIKERIMLHMFEHYACMHVYAWVDRLISAEVRRRCHITWKWSHRSFWVSMWILRIESWSSGKSKNALKYLAIPWINIIFFIKHRILGARMTNNIWMRYYQLNIISNQCIFTLIF